MSLFDKALESFRQPEDIALLNRQSNRAKELQQIKDLLDSEGGKTLKTWLVKDIADTVEKLTNTREEYLISDLKAKLALYNKLNVKGELNAINKWLEDILKD